MVSLVGQERNDLLGNHLKQDFVIVGMTTMSVDSRGFGTKTAKNN